MYGWFMLLTPIGFILPFLFYPIHCWVFSVNKRSSTFDKVGLWIWEIIVISSIVMFMLLFGFSDPGPDGEMTPETHIDVIWNEQNQRYHLDVRLSPNVSYEKITLYILTPSFISIYDDPMENGLGNENMTYVVLDNDNNGMLSIGDRLQIYQNSTIGDIEEDFMVRLIYEPTGDYIAHVRLVKG